MRIRRVAQYLALALLPMAAPVVSEAQIGIGISIRIAPPVLPVYVQPACPIEGYLWTPGYWAYGPMGYYWVPGVWVAPPRVGVLWTPGYWGLAAGVYGWHAGYWGPHIGFYGGVNYGFGYGGVGFIGGAWAGNVFRYNTAVVNVNTTVVHNVYVDRTVIHNTVESRASFNGPGGVVAQPRPEERLAAREQHMAPTPNQLSHEHSASQNRQQLASVNGGHPAAAAMDRPGGRQFGEHGPAAAAARTAGPAPRPNSPPAQHVNAAAEHHNDRPAQPQQAHQAAARPAAEHSRPADHGKPQKSQKEGREK